MAAPVKIPLSKIHPTEYLIPDDRLEEIAAHYDGRPESIKPIMVVRDPVTGVFYPENGNKRGLFLLQKGCDYVLGHVSDGADFPDDLEDYRNLARKAEAHGVNTLEDLKERIVSRAEFDRRMK
ncbi:hypothetical protein JW898_04085 [Candidatus Woesearchaeota archaeon]|nr:hypothetical protein [Candidatus Woesearchaeota archaeon]